MASSSRLREPSRAIAAGMRAASAVVPVKLALRLNLLVGDSYPQHLGLIDPGA